MPNIADLFNVGQLPEGEQAPDGDFDVSEFLRSVDEITASRPGGDPALDMAAGVNGELSGDETPPGSAPKAGETSQQVVDPPALAPVVEPLVAPVAHDPLLELSPERRAYLLALDEVIQEDPTRRDAVLRAMSAEPQRAPEPTLPEEIDEHSFEAQLWRENRELNSRIDRLTSGLESLNRNTATQTAQTAAQQGISSFAAAHPELAPEDVQEIVQWAGRAGIPAGFVQMDRYREQPAMAIRAALNFALHENEQFEARSIARAANSAISGGGGDGGGEPIVPALTAAQIAQQEAASRKRTLTALSGAASPTAAGPVTRTPLTTRSDGRFDPDSRTTLVNEIATSLNRSRQAQQ